MNTIKELGLELDVLKRCFDDCYTFATIIKNAHLNSKTQEECMLQIQRAALAAASIVKDLRDRCDNG